MTRRIDRIAKTKTSNVMIMTFTSKTTLSAVTVALSVSHHKLSVSLKRYARPCICNAHRIVGVVATLIDRIAQ
jgi:hypothetical protein